MLTSVLRSVTLGDMFGHKLVASRMWQAQSLGMSSDSLADLGRSLGRVSEEIIRLVDTSKRRNAGSPADKEADVKPVPAASGACILAVTWSRRC